MMVTNTTTPDPSPGLVLPEVSSRTVPRPENQTAFLVNADGAWTLHVYSETRLTDKAPEGHLNYEFMFTCTKTNQRRRYGVEDIPKAKPALPLEAWS